MPAYDEKCYLCPGNERAGGTLNPKYSRTFIFVNDYSAVKESQAEYTPDAKDEEFFRAESVTGKCYVLTFSPAHNITLADMQPAEILPIVETWTKLYAAHLDPESGLAKVAKPILSSMEGDSITIRSGKQLRYMQIFENKGAAMGCSNPHPHGQAWATSSLPEEIDCELKQLHKYRASHADKHMLEDYAALESLRQERVVFQNDSFLVVCPWWAIWPFEVMILSRCHLRSLVDFSDTQRTHLAEAIAEVTRRYDNLFETQFPYSMGIHQAPLSGTPEEMEDSYFHMHFYPPLLRSATVRKFLVG